MPRVVLDTNILVSATLVPEGRQAQIVEAFEAGLFELVASDSILEEYIDVIRRPRITRKHPDAARRSEELLLAIQARAVMVSGITNRRYVLSDPEDDMIVACALEGKAELVVSGDSHLTSLETIRGVRIRTPKQFVEEVLNQ